MIIGIDFDGTCTTHDFPRVGKDIGAVPVLKKLTEKGHKLILFTMRSDHWELGDHVYDKETDMGFFKSQAKKHNYLQAAVDWFKENDIPLYGIQTNPEQSQWTTSPKAYCQMYIDDAALGCPLMYDESLSSRPFVNWTDVEKILTQFDIL